MTLRDLMQEYRSEHNLSQRQFALECGLSNGYISMLEKNLNPKTGLPVTPSLPALKKIASGMGITLTDLLSLVDDMPVDLFITNTEEKPTPVSESGPNRNVLRLAGRDGSYVERNLTDEQMAAIRMMIEQLPDADDL